MAATSSYNRLTLLGLPQELKDRIYSYVVVDDHPLLTFAMRRLRHQTPNDIKSNTDDPIQKARGHRVVHEMKAFPLLPAAAYACRDMTHDIVAAFYRDNIFLFSLKDRSTLWVMPWYCEINGKEDAILASNLQHIIVELLVSCEAGVPHEHGEMDIRLLKDRSLSFRFGGALENECTCWIEPFVASHNQFGRSDNGRNALVDFAIEFERLRLEKMTEPHRLTFPKSCQGRGESRANYLPEDVADAGSLMKGVQEVAVN